MFFGGTADVLLKNCGIIVNSDDADGAMTATGASVVGATYADVVGGIDQSNNANLDFGDVNTGAPDPTNQRALNWTAIFDEMHDFELNTRGTSAGVRPGSGAAPPGCGARGRTGRARAVRACRRA